MPLDAQRMGQFAVLVASVVGKEVCQVRNTQPINKELVFLN